MMAEWTKHICLSGQECDNDTQPLWYTKVKADFDKNKSFPPASPVLWDF